MEGGICQEPEALRPEIAQRQTVDRTQFSAGKSQRDKETNGLKVEE